MQLKLLLFHPQSQLKVTQEAGHGGGDVEAGSVRGHQNPAGEADGGKAQQVVGRQACLDCSPRTAHLRYTHSLQLGTIGAEADCLQDALSNSEIVSAQHQRQVVQRQACQDRGPRTARLQCTRSAGCTAAVGCGDHILHASVRTVSAQKIAAGGRRSALPLKS